MMYQSELNINHGKQWFCGDDKGFVDSSKLSFLVPTSRPWIPALVSVILRNNIMLFVSPYDKLLLKFLRFSFP